MSQNPKVSKALAVTRALGIPDEKIRPILKNLFKLYGKNWELIEEDNYRTLLDAYFELNENKETDNKNPSMAEKHGVERPAKRVCMEDQEKEVSVSDRAHCSSRLLHAHSIDKGKKPISSHLPLKEAAMSSMEKESLLLKRKSMAEGGSLQVHKQSNKELVMSKVESPSMHPPRSCESSSSGPRGSQRPLNISSSRNYSIKPVASSNFDMDERDDCSNRNDYTRRSEIQIASSSLGEIKLFLNCRSNLFQQTFQRPKLDSVMKLVEEKCRRTYKISGQNISMAKLLNDLCECFLKMGKDSFGKSKLVGSAEGVSYVSNTREELKRKAICINNSEKCPDLKVHNSNGNTSSNGNMVVQKQPSIIDQKRFSCNLVDITKGTENVKILIVDESGKEELPRFNYISHNIVYQNAHVQFSLARISDEDCCSSCSGDCLSATLPCACARETGGEFAYTPEGLLKEEFLDPCIEIKNNPQAGHYLYCQDCPIERSKNELKPEKCNGHLVRKFVKECWRKCGCNMQCGNRVVQRGITRKLQVFLTEGGKGWGVRSVEDLPKGAFVCEYVGEIVTNTELYYRNMQISENKRHTYPVTLDADWGSEGVLQDEEALCLDATYHGNVARFINHRCHDANLIDIPVEIETPDRHYYHLAFFTTRKVSALEELTWDYGIDFADYNHPIDAFQCSCGSAYCRDINQKGGSTSKAIKLRRYGDKIL